MWPVYAPSDFLWVCTLTLVHAKCLTTYINARHKRSTWQNAVPESVRKNWPPERRRPLYAVHARWPAVWWWNAQAERGTLWIRCGTYTWWCGGGAAKHGPYRKTLSRKYFPSRSRMSRARPPPGAKYWLAMSYTQTHTCTETQKHNAAKHRVMIHVRTRLCIFIKAHLIYGK